MRRASPSGALTAAIVLAAGTLFACQVHAQAPEPKAVFDAGCAVCHKVGINGAPRIDDPDDWRRRLAGGGLDALVQTAIAGRAGMPPRGGNPSLSDAVIRATVGHMLALAGVDPAREVAAGASESGKGQGGAAVVAEACVACHGPGVAGAPKLGDTGAWRARLERGRDVLVRSVVEGKGAMPPKAGRADLSVAQIEAAVDFMLVEAGLGTDSARATPSAARAKGDAAERPALAALAAPTPRTAPPGGADSAAAVASSKPTRPSGSVSRVNSFNRLMRPPGKRNPPPMRDGIHDPRNEGTAQLQAPLQAYDPLPKSGAGNGIDWVRAIEEGLIAPRADKDGSGPPMAVMDMNIVREVKGSMPDVVYPHKQHTEWLDCGNCHPAIFVPRKGANQISMASIMLGEKCGVCHGKVAFPVAECRRCHSRNKPALAGGGGGK